MHDRVVDITMPTIQQCVHARDVCGPITPDLLYIPYFPPSQLCIKQLNFYKHFRPVFLLSSFSGIYVA